MEKIIKFRLIMLLTTVITLFFSCTKKEDEIILEDIQIRELTVTVVDGTTTIDVTAHVYGSNIERVSFTLDADTNTRDYDLKPEESGSHIYKRSLTLQKIDYEEQFPEELKSHTTVTAIGKGSNRSDSKRSEGPIVIVWPVTSTKHLVTIENFVQTKFSNGTLDAAINYSNSNADGAKEVLINVYPNSDTQNPITLKKAIGNGNGSIPFTVTDGRITDGSTVLVEVVNVDENNPLFSFSYNGTTKLSASDQIIIDASLVNASLSGDTITSYVEAADIVVNAKGDNGANISIIVKNRETGEIVFTGSPTTISNGVANVQEMVTGLVANTKYIAEYYTNYVAGTAQQAFGFGDFTTKPEMDIKLSILNADTNSFQIEGDYTSFHRESKEIVIEVFRADGNFVKASDPITLVPSESINDFNSFFDGLDGHSGQTLVIKVKRVDNNKYIDGAETTATLLNGVFTVNSFAVLAADITKTSFIAKLNTSNGTKNQITGKLRAFYDDGTQPLQVGSTRNIEIPASTENHPLSFEWTGIPENLQGKTLDLIIEWDNNTHSNSEAEVTIPAGEFTVSNLTVQSINETSFTLKGTATNTTTSTKTGKVYLFEEDGSLVNIPHHDIIIPIDVTDDGFEVSYSNLPTDLQGQNVTVRITWDDNAHSDTVAAAAIPMPEVNVDSFTISDETIKSAIANIQVDNAFTSSLPKEDIQVKVYNSSSVLLGTFIAPADIPAMAVNDSFDVNLVGLKNYNGQTLSAKLFIKDKELASKNFTLVKIEVKNASITEDNSGETSTTLGITYMNNDDISQGGKIVITDKNGQQVSKNISFSSGSITVIQKETISGLGNLFPKGLKAELVWDNQVIAVLNSFDLAGEVQATFAGTEDNSITTNDVEIKISMLNTYSGNKSLVVKLWDGTDNFHTGNISLGGNTNTIKTISHTIQNQYKRAGRTITVQLLFNGELLSTGSFKYKDVSVTNISTVRTRTSFPSNNTSGVNMLYKRFTTDGVAPIETLSLFVKPAQTSSAFVQIQEIVSDIRIRFGSTEFSPFSFSWTSAGNGYYRVIIDLTSSVMKTGTGTRTNTLYVDMKTQNFSALGKSGNDFDIYASIKVDGVIYGDNPGTSDIVTISAP